MSVMSRVVVGSAAENQSSTAWAACSGVKSKVMAGIASWRRATIWAPTRAASRRSIETRWPPSSQDFQVSTEALGSRELGPGWATGH